ncbi:unnamed protein product [Polarella glacialis]|uniref:Uncharacterized protein n=1 Tax=Polarella glacialis TaxID=89957 RepID=A0A813DFF8_POLGL|nr:unnamed protein product [Polarella glacialis]
MATPLASCLWFLCGNGRFSRMFMAANLVLLSLLSLAYFGREMSLQANHRELLENAVKELEEELNTLNRAAKESSLQASMLKEKAGRQPAGTAIVLWDSR